MNVTNNGPAGYEYQYLASVYLILSFMQKGELKGAVIDSLNKEDLHMTVRSNYGVNEAIEVQFKKKRGALNINQFAAFWTHFNARSDQVNVLSKLIDGTAAYYYLVCSSRANDYAEDLGVLTNATTLLRYENGEPKKVNLKLFGDTIKLQHKKTNGKPSKRNDFVIKQADVLLNDTTLFESVLKKSYVLDKLDDLTLRSVIGTLLSNLHIPATKEELLLLKLVELVKQARGTNHNILQDFSDLLQQTVSNLPNVVENYIKPDQEDSLLTELSNNGILLLTGVTMCGKTQIAQSVIKRLVQADPRIIYFPTGDVEQARLVLLDQANESRVCYLEDPLELQSGTSKLITLKKIDALRQQMPKIKGRYLVVTTTSQALQALNIPNAGSGPSWITLTVTNRDFLKLCWAQIKQRCPEISSQVNRIVTAAIENDPSNELLQPGQLDYLGRNIALLVSETEASVKLLANVGAQNIEQQILQETAGVIEAAIILSVTTTTLTGPGPEDLQYICGEEPFAPGLVKQEVGSMSSSIGSARTAPSYKLNTYSNLTPVPVAIILAMEKLTDNGYLRYVYKEPRFIHPIFQDGTRRLLGTSIPSRFSRIIFFTRRAVSSLNVRVATNAVRCLDILYDQNDQRQDNQIEIFSIAEDGLRSTFVNVRNLSILFLIAKFQQLDLSQQRKILDTIIHRSFGKDTYHWQDGQAFIPDTKNIDTTGTHNYKSRQAQQKEWANYLKNGKIPKPEEAFNLLKGLFSQTRYHKARISFQIAPLLNFLNYEESFIRERAAFLIAASITDHDVPLLKDLFNDGSPFIIYELIRGLFRSWPYLNAMHKNEMLVIMKDAFDSPFSSLSAIDLFTQFNAGHTSYTFDWREDIEDHVAPDMWFLWGELMVIFFKYLPYEIFIHKDRFLDALMNAKISNQLRWNMVQAWLVWLPGHLNAASPIKIDQHLLYFVELFFKNIDPVNRLVLIKQLLAISNTQFNGGALRRIINFWDSLTLPETEYLRVYTEKADHFTQSVILTTADVPLELQKVILNGESITGKSAAELIAKLSPIRLQEGLTILFIDQSASDLPYGATEVWKSALPYLIQYPEQPGFDIALYIMINTIIWDFGDKTMWLNPNAILKTIIHRGDPKTNELVFYFLLEGLTGNPHSNCKEFWKIFFENIGTAERDTYGDILAEKIEAITYRKNAKKLPNDILLEFIEPVISKIRKIIEVFTTPIFDLGDEGKKTFAFAIVMFIKANELHVWKMYEACRDWARVNRMYFKEEELELIEDFSDQFFATERAQASAVEQRNITYFKNYLT